MWKSTELIRLPEAGDLHLLCPTCPCPGRAGGRPTPDLCDLSEAQQLAQPQEGESHRGACDRMLGGAASGLYAKQDSLEQLVMEPQEMFRPAALFLTSHQEALKLKILRCVTMKEFTF